MNLQPRGEAPQVDNGARKQRRNGRVHDALHDADVMRMMSAEVDRRSARRHGKIQEAAYFLAERRGFEGGHELDDWLAAEAQIARAGRRKRGTQPRST